MVLCIVLSYAAEASVVGVSPSIVRFDSMLREGYASETIQASTSIKDPLKATLTSEGEIADWISYEPDGDEFTFSLDKPYNFNLIVQPPLDAANGNYSGIVKVTTSEIASVDIGAGSSVIAQVAILVFVEVVDNEIISCRAGAISLSSAEIGDKLPLRATVFNDGNTRLRPEVIIDVYDQLKTELLYSTSFYGTSVLPTREGKVSENLDHDLDVGQYVADITFTECDVTRETLFDIVEKGGIADVGTLIGINTNSVGYKDEPLPIGAKFRNDGKTIVVATFNGEIKDMKRDRVLGVLKSDSLEVSTGDTIEFNMYYTPEKTGDYLISGRVVYNNKLTYEERSRQFEIINRNGVISGWPFFLFIYVIILLVILILIGKIKKAKRNKF